MKTNNHGGKRKNSGRKPTGRTLEKKIMIKPEHWEKLQDIGGPYKVSATLGRILDEKFAEQEGKGVE